jgi:hypothetical protein
VFVVSKFSNAPVKASAPATGPLKTKKSGARALTREGGVGHVKGDKTALFTLAVTNMVREPTYYESAGKRDSRMVDLVRKVAVADPEWIQAFVPYLRNVANMRSASIVIAAEAAKALLDARPKGVQVTPISIPDLIDSAIVRGDEPAEMLGYWMSVYGRRVPMGVKRGVARAAERIFNERNAIKYDTNSQNMRYGDVIELTHPTPKAPWQSTLFNHLITRRQGREDISFEGLPVLAAANRLESIPESKRREAIKAYGPEVLNDAGFTWERLSSWIPGGMDAAAWEAIIPSMGYMALLRNLRNFEQAKVSKSVLKTVRDTLEDPEAVAKSRQFPYRFYSAWKNSGSTYFASALETALELSTANIPEFSGRTGVLIDTSGSMGAPVSGRSDIAMWEIGALFAASVAARSGDCVLGIYGDFWNTVPVDVSVLRTVDRVSKLNGSVGHGTQTWPSALGMIAEHGPFDRLLVFTDMQDHPPTGAIRGASGRSSWGRASGKTGLDGFLPEGLSVFAWDLSGQPTSNLNTNTPGRYLLSGFSDNAFKLVGLLEDSVGASWPWEN